VGDDLETELVGCVCGRCRGYERFDHRQDGVRHNDHAFVVAVAALALQSEAGAPAFWHETPPLCRGVWVVRVLRRSHCPEVDAKARRRGDSPRIRRGGIEATPVPA
jgi:hypothetical protein